MERVTRVLEESVTRRRLLGLLIGAGAAVSTWPLVTSAATGAGTYRTTAALNLRAGPSTSSRVLRVMPAGAIVVDYDGVLSNGFRGVDYKGTVGWASDAYLVLVSAPSDPVFVGTAKTTAAVNLRSGPSTSNQVLRVVPAGTWVQISDTVQNGFRYVIHNGLAGWISDAFLGGSNTGAFVTTARVNMRTGPGTNNRVILIIPVGATVIDYDGEIVNGFRGVDYNGTVGWVSNAFLRK